MSSLQKMLMTRGLLLLATALLYCGSSGAEESAIPSSKTSSTLDALERQLEMGRHQNLVARKTQPASQLQKFTTDGCSGGLSIGWEYLAGRIRQIQQRHGKRPPWEECCITHDRAYHTGGAHNATAAESFKARKSADLALKSCVMETGTKRLSELSTGYNLSAREVKLLYTTIAELMYRAVRIGGMPCTALPWRWGYGWPACS